MIRLFTACAAVVSLLTAAFSSAASFTPPADGWASWDVPAVADAPAWCCSGPGNSASSTTACKLDGKESGYVSSHDRTTDAVRIYAHFTGGKLDRMRTFAASCAVQANTEIRKLTPSEQASAEWLSGLLDSKLRSDRVRGDVMAALAVHRTPLAYDSLASIARTGTELEERKNAVFWLAHLRGREGAELTTSIMFRDTNARMREHAAFAITQSKSPRVAEDLTRLATTDRDPHVRGQAWFWLAQSGSPQAEASLTGALRKESDAHVREQAIFALSQLPGDRATRALISVAENRSLPTENRKRAIFWLAQGDSDGALAYLDKVLQASR